MKTSHLNQLITYKIIKNSRKSMANFLGYRINIFLISSCLISSTVLSQNLDLSGMWNFKIDSLDEGITRQWFNQQFSEEVHLPGSMAENGKGNDITPHTEWTGNIVDQSWFTDVKYKPYRKKDNIKIPFWLQPVKHFQGAAWYQKKVKIPAEWEKRHIELILERPHWETKVWIDGELAGMRNQLGALHSYDLTHWMMPGDHMITIRVDNRIKDINPGVNSHSISDHTQSNWNGIAGQIRLNAKNLVWIDQVKLYPDINKKVVLVKARIKNQSGVQQSGRMTMVASLINVLSDKVFKEKTIEISVQEEEEIEMVYPLGDDPLLWDEFQPNLYELSIKLKTPIGVDLRDETFGMRDFGVQGKQFHINGKLLFLRGTLECSIFPKTGYPATGVAEWKRIINVCKAHGLNHMRFHSWCPPEAAFVAADQLGFYFQVECSSWANQGSSIGDGNPVDQWLYEEAEAILNAYGNHPSFCMMAYGNEPGGKNQVTYLESFVDHWKNKDPRRVYTGGAGWPLIQNMDFFNAPGARIQGWGQELKSIINSQAPQTHFDYEDIINKTPVPYVSHEIGQWCVYPNFKEISKYTGVLKPKNFEIFEESLMNKRLHHLADSFLLASGKLQALCYKADIEAALRTHGMAGFQLLDLHDFPGQGTALVGVLDPFWEEKGYISPEEYSRFCNQTVPLSRLGKRIFSNQDIFEAAVEVAHFGPESLKNISTQWSLAESSGANLVTGHFDPVTIPQGNGIKLGRVTIPLKEISTPQKLVFTVNVAGFVNHWDIWVYPSGKHPMKKDRKIKVVQKIDKKVTKFLLKGGKVLLTPIRGELKPEKGGDIGIGFSSIFWNTAWTKGQKPHTLGILCDPDHPALEEFPTEYHSNWQWWDAMSHSNAIILDKFPQKLKPIVRVIDDWFTNRSLGLIFEVKVGKGKLIITGIDLLSDLDNRLEAQQLLYSLKKYMHSNQFAPSVELRIEEIIGLFK